MKKHILYILLLLLIAFPVDAQVRPSYHQGFATRSLSKRPSLWKGLVGCWKPSLGVTGNALRDISGFHRHFDLAGTYNWTNEGIDIVTDTGYATVDPGINTAGFNGLSIVVKIRSNQGSGGSTDRAVFLHDAEPDFEHFIQLLGNGTIFWQINSNGTDEAIEVDVGTRDMEEHTVIGTYDGSEMKLYFDGVEIGSTSYSQPLRATAGVTTINRIWVGGSPITGGDSLYRDIRIYNRGLLPNEVWDIQINPNAMFQFRDVILVKPPVGEPPSETTQVYIISQLMQKADKGI